MFKRILIANRGEIACRIIKTAKKMGIETVAVYSDADRESLHVLQADMAWHIGPAPSKDSYLNIPAIIKAAAESKAEAIHPGYGFLSENPMLAQACEKAGIVFIGPSVEALKAMGSKQLAKQMLEKTQVPLTPGYHGKNQSDELLLSEAQKIGFPVLLKAASGGGGKGMRSVKNASEFKSSLESARREAKASFGDDTMIIEKQIIDPRHIEIQIMADNHGKVLHLFERDCSIQRRHQKIIEEAPAPDLPEALRTKLAQSACEVSRTIQYRGAGTIEFLVDIPNNQYYFMEMNTRLQVEHPVTEMITGLDLVELQFQVAANQPLNIEQKDIRIHGHAMECRIYAEDPTRDFLPSIGTIEFLQEPSGQHIRIDTGVSLHSAITQYYDPMIAKLITHGANRNEALQKMHQALMQYAIGGVKTNIPFLKAICSHSSFMKPILTTHFLDSQTIDMEIPDSEEALLMAAGCDYLTLVKNTMDPLHRDVMGWQLYQKGSWIKRYFLNDAIREISISTIDNHRCCVTVDNIDYHLHIHRENNQWIVDTGKRTLRFLAQYSEKGWFFYTDRGNIEVPKYTWQSQNTHATHRNQLTAPMPATIVAILKQAGDTVKAGEGLMVLEAMKMEHTIHAPVDGKLKAVFYSVGAQVGEGAELLALDE